MLLESPVVRPSGPRSDHCRVGARRDTTPGGVAHGDRWLTVRHVKLVPPLVPYRVPPHEPSHPVHTTSTGPAVASAPIPGPDIARCARPPATPGVTPHHVILRAAPGHTGTGVAALPRPYRETARCARPPATPGATSHPITFRASPGHRTGHSLRSRPGPNATPHHPAQMARSLAGAPARAAARFIVWPGGERGPCLTKPRSSDLSATLRAWVPLAGGLPPPSGIPCRTGFARETTPHQLAPLAPPGFAGAKRPSKLGIYTTPPQHRPVHAHRHDLRHIGQAHRPARQSAHQSDTCELL